jgi:hypothetical protein
MLSLVRKVIVFIFCSIVLTGCNPPTYGFYFYPESDKVLFRYTPPMPHINSNLEILEIKIIRINSEEIYKINTSYSPKEKINIIDLIELRYKEFRFDYSSSCLFILTLRDDDRIYDMKYKYVPE